MKKAFLLTFVLVISILSIYELTLHYKNPVMITDHMPNFPVLSDFTLHGTNVNVVRMHIIDVNHPDDVLVSRARRAVVERKVGVVYFKGDYPKSLLLETENVIKSVGFSIGRPQPFAVPKYLNVLAAALLVLFLGVFIDKRFFLLFVFVVFDFWLNLSVYLIYFVAFFVPALYIPKSSKSYFMNFFFIIIIGVSMHFLFFQTKYLVGAAYPRAIKAVLILPFFFLIYKYKIKFTKKDLKWILILTVLGIIYILKSGNYIEPTIFERRIRDYLDTIFYVRPRFKELLIGFPLLWIVGKHKVKNKFIILLSILAYVSVFDSFLHPYTDAVISAYRSSLSLFIGILIGEFYYSFYRFIKRKFENG